MQLSEQYVPDDDQLSGARITEVLGRSDVGLSGSIGTIDNGSIRLQGGSTDADGNVSGHSVAAGTNVLAYLQTLARTEWGKFFVDAAGDLQFRSRFNFPSAVTSASFDDFGTDLPFSGVRVAFGSERRAWRASVQRVGGVAQIGTSSDTPPTALGQRTIALTGLLFRGDAYCRSLAQHLADRYAQVEAFIESLTVPLAKLGTSDRATVCGLDINDTVDVSWQPTGAGNRVSQTLVVEGVTYRHDEIGNGFVDLQLSAYPDTNYLVYDTDEYDDGIPYGF